MKNRITLTNHILPAGRIMSVAATLALLIATGAPALAKPAPGPHAIAAPMPALRVRSQSALPILSFIKHNPEILFNLLF
jgi:hypothetical protein